LNKEILQEVYQRIENLWLDTGAWSDFVEAMRHALVSNQSENQAPEKSSSRWGLLPRLCCQAAGGEPKWALDIAAAWYLFYIAADIMDDVEDRDVPDSWWAELGPGAAINAASGLFFSASAVLQNLYLQKEIAQQAAAEIARYFHSSFLVMCSGQHRDLLIKSPGLEEYWETALAKSGTFFGLACWSGARLATGDLNRLEGFEGYGLHLGALIQIMDDLEDLHALESSNLAGLRIPNYHSLPVVYSLEVLPPVQKTRLQVCLKDASHNLQAVGEAWQLIEQSGAAVYLVAEIERHKSQALSSLAQAQPLSPAQEVLSSFIHNLAPV
jgi:geranylgeranyl pyrophosphate synthase